MRAIRHLLLALAASWTAGASAGSSLCLLHERTLWECPAPKKAYALCASPDLAASSGYLQYRAGAGGSAEFSFPSDKRHPRGHFRYTNYGRFARLTFENGAYAYEIEEQLVGPTTIRVTRGGRLAGEFDCSSASRTLMDTEVMRMFSLAGVSAE